MAAIQGFGQGKGDIVNDVKETIKAGSAKELVRFLNQNVDIELNGKKETYSKAQAEVILRDFFKSNVPSDFTILHKGQSKSGQPFAIGQYKSGVASYRVFMKIKTMEDQQLIHEISFSKE
ncbi:DUF4783 domain-containing protein [Chryseotalea sanaruensis]|uniref:DUF4783 domain-containing protein n=2 Tax=Chryseotalea sanaruensis TaxID=2482724 RepID=A0A401U8H5_9BACT|nr:DUF4783 domain-containing protein [Chryseotalea sanaruensis]